ncbi:MAG: hypothetical protein ACOYBY_08525 [Dermatophilaceae bacterium]
MQGVGPGSLLGGRYAVRGRLSHHPQWERWSASDTALDREVVLLCFPRSAPPADAALDAARRAAGVEEHRLTRVLDVGQEPELVFVVEEPMSGATTLTSMLADGGLPADDVRRLVGEAAGGLAAASSRGLHHGVLTPRDVLVLPDGTVKVRGLATQAALLGEEDRPAEQASRADAVALAGLLYAGLTGRWPLPGPDSGLEAAPRIVSGVAAPSQIAAGVPYDIDGLVTSALTDEGGPRTPAEVAEQLFPGAPGPRRRPLASPSTAATRAATTRTATTRTNPLPRDPPTGGVALGQPPSAPGPPRGAGRPGGGAQSRPAAADVSARRAGTAAAGAAPNGTATATPQPAPSHRTSAAVAAATSAAAVAATATGSAAKTAGRGVRTGLDTVGSGASVVARQAKRAARATADRAAERAATKAERRRFESMPDDLFEMQEASLTEVLQETDEQLEPPVPIRLAADAPTLPNRPESKLALAIVAAFVILAALLGIWGLPQIGSLPTSSSGGSSAPTGGTGEGATGGSGQAGQAGDQLTPVAVIGAATFEPANGGQVPSASAAKAYDGNPETGWESKWFTTAKFGGLPVQGIGLIVDLGQQTDVRRVTLNLPAAQDGTVYVANQASLEGATTLGTFTNQKGTIVVDSANGAPAKGQLVIVYVTRLGPDGEGKFRAQVSEIQVSK